MDKAPFLPKPDGRLDLRNPAKRTVVLWLVLVAMFLVLFQVLGGGSNSAMPQTSTSDGHDFWSATLERLLPMAAMFLLLVGLLIWIFRRTQAFNGANASALKLLAEGDYAKAQEEYEAIAKRYRWPASLRAVASFNVAVAQLHRGHFGDALARFEDIERRATWAVAGLRPNLACQLALAYALQGNLDAARTWRAESERRMKAAGDQATLQGLLAYVDAVVEVREDRCATFLRWLEERWAQLDGTLTARTTRPLRVLRAFAIARTAGVREAGVVQMALSALAPVRTGEFAMLRTHWPELDAFLLGQGF